MVNRIRAQRPRLVRSVSVATRPRRPGERHGRDYRFVSPEMFRRLRRAGRLLEWARVHGAWYGTPKQPVLQALAQGRDVVLSIDVQGARQIRRALSTRAVLIFLVPPSLEQLRRRLMRRRTESPSAIRKRIAAAKRELACAAWYDYRVVNDRLEHTVAQVKAIIARGGGAWHRSRSKNC